MVVVEWRGGGGGKCGMGVAPVKAVDPVEPVYFENNFSIYLVELIRFKKVIVNCIYWNLLPFLWCNYFVRILRFSEVLSKDIHMWV